MFKAAAGERVLADGQVTWVREKVKTGVRMAPCRLPGSVLAFSLTKGSLVFREGPPRGLEATKRGREGRALGVQGSLHISLVTHTGWVQGVKCKGGEATSIFHQSALACWASLDSSQDDQ